jgi:branched-chain amino acid transport system substrate-binding protein
MIFGLAIALAAAAISSGKTAETVRIGLMVPLTGPAVQTGVEVQALARLFGDVINAKGHEVKLPFWDSEGLPNLGNAKVEFVVGDLSTPDIAMLEAERLITEEGVIGLAGNFSSASTKTVMVMAEKYGVIVLSEGTSESLPEEGYTYYGRSYPGDNIFVRDTFEFMKWLNERENAAIRRVALVCEDSEFGANIRKVEQRIAKEYGFEIVEDIYYSATASNVTSEVLRLKDADADVVVMSSYIADSLLFMTTFKEQNYFPRMLFGQRGGFASSDFMRNLKRDADYVMSTARWNTDFKSAVSRNMARIYQERYSGGIELIGDVLASAWDAYLLAVIANQAGSTDADDMRAAMRQGVALNPEEDPTGLPGYKYAENGQNEFTVAIVIQMKDNQYHTVYPESVASFKPVYPAPNWSDRK